MPFGIKDVELVERIRWLEVLVKKKTAHRAVF